MNAAGQGRFVSVVMKHRRQFSRVVRTRRRRPQLKLRLREYEDFYYAHRPTSGMANARPLAPLPEPISDRDELTQLRIRRRDRLGALLHEYQHAA